MGDQIDDVAIVDAIEDAGAWLVMDDISTGSKMYWADVDVTCRSGAGHRRAIPQKAEVADDLRRRRRYVCREPGSAIRPLKRYIEEFKVDGGHPFHLQIL